MRFWRGTAAFLLGLAVVVAWMVHAASSPPPALAGSYRFEWASEVWGYGSYTAALADLDGDGDDELVVQGLAGEYEGQEPPPSFNTAVFDRSAGSAQIVERAQSLELGELVAATDLDGDGRAEMVAREGFGPILRAWGLDRDGAGISAVPDGLLEAYRERGGLLLGDMAGTLDRWPRDLDGDGLLDALVLAQGEAGSEILLRTAAGEQRIPLTPAGGAGEGAPDAGESPAEGALDPAHVQVEAWLPPGEAGWPFLLVGVRPEGSRRVHLTLWQPDPEGYRAVWQSRLEGGSGPYDLPPAWALLELTGDGTPELVQGRGGVIEVLSWTGQGFDRRLARTPDNGGLGWAGFHAADLNGNQVPELVARHVSPNLYTHNLKVYEMRNHRLVGLADLKAIGSTGSAPPLVWSGAGGELLLLQREFERARPEALGFGR